MHKQSDVLDDIDIDDQEDWEYSDWTEIIDSDITSGQDDIPSHSDIRNGLINEFKTKFEQLNQQIWSSVNKYLSDVPVRGVNNEIEKFLAIAEESKSLETKIKEEQEDNLRLSKKLNDLDSKLSWLLANQIGNTISLECDYIDSKADLLKEKTAVSTKKALLIENSAENLLYSDKRKNTLDKVKALLMRKIEQNKVEKDRLIKECKEYQENRLQLKPLVHQYSEIIKQTREIDKQVSQLMKY